MPARHRHRPLSLALAVAATAPALLAAGRAEAATYVFSNPDGGALNVATNYAPSGVPGSADVVRIDALPTIPGFLELRVADAQSIGRLELNHFAPTTISADLDASSQPHILTLTTGQLAFTDALTEAPDVPLNTLAIYAPIAGGAGLTKSGTGFAFLGGNNLYTGGTTISGVGSPSGGLSVAADAALGTAGGAINLNQGGVLRAVSSFATSRTVNVAASGGHIESYGTLTLNGAIAGSGSLNISRFTGGTVVMAANNPFSGALNISNGNRVNLTGRLASVGSITLAGTLDLGTERSNAAAPALPAGITIESHGGTLTLAGGASSNSSVTVHGVRLEGGTTTLNLEVNGTGGAAMNFTELSRVNRSTLFVRGRNLGTAPLGSNVSVINFTGAIPTVGGNGSTGTNDPIVPFIFGNRNTTGGISAVSVVDAGFVTRTGNGLAPLDGSRYATTLRAADATSPFFQDNVRVSDTVINQGGNAIMNALLIRDTTTSGGNTGVTGTGTLTVTSGAILAVSDLSADELFIDNPLNFGAAEGVVHTAQAADGHSQLFLRGAISGSNGLTKSGSGELFLESTASTFGGPTTINAGMVIFAGSIAANAPSALGSSSADVVINAGVTDGQYVGLSSVAAGATFERNIVVQRNANSLAYIGAYGGLAATFTGQVSIGSGYLNLFGNIEPEMLTLSGAISGAGGLQEPGTQFPSLQHLRITAANTYSGGTVIRAGQWEVGSDSALGTGTVFFVGNNVDGSVQTGALQATNGPRTLANRLVLRATPVFSGNDALTFTGPVDLGSIPREVNVSSAADVTLAGAVGRGGLTKTGSGRLILSGPNTFNGQAVVAEGTLQAAHGSALGAATGPTMPGQATFITGSGTLELAGNISSAEAIYLGSDGAPITGSSPTGNLRSISGNNTLTGQLALDNLATVGVDAGSTLTLTATSVDNTTSANAALRKVGGGTLAVRNVRVPTLAISEGTVRVTSAGAPVGTSRISSLTVNAGAVLDLTNNAIVYDYAATSPLTSVRSLLAAGQIVTTAAQAGARVGYAEASSVFTGTFPQSFAGQAVDNTTVLLLQTLAGDANLDRLVNFADLVSLAQNYNQGPNLVWRSGDFNYDGTVNFPDLVLLAQNYNRTASASLTAAAVTAQFGTELGADWAMAQSLVPEPTALGLLALALPLARRRR